MEVTRVFGIILSLALLQSAVRVLSATLPAPAAYSVTLAWDGSPSPEIAGYRIYYGTASRVYTNSILVGNVRTNTIAGLAGGVTYFFAATAYNASGVESDFSNEIIYVPGFPRVRTRVTPSGQVVLTAKGLLEHTYEILATQTLEDWIVIGRVRADANGALEFVDPDGANYPYRFYRTHGPQP